MENTEKSECVHCLVPLPHGIQKSKSMHEIEISHSQKKGIGKPLICLTYIPWHENDITMNQIMQFQKQMENTQ